jgi:hypothetical protein
MFEYISNNVDWSALFTGAFIGAIGSYFGYFKAKFKEYGKIEGRLQKLDELVKIESTLAKTKEVSAIYSKFEHLDKLVTIESEVMAIKTITDIQSQHDNKELLKDIERVLSDSRDSSEYSYWKRKNDLGKLEEFFTLIWASAEIKQIRITDLGSAMSLKKETTGDPMKKILVVLNQLTSMDREQDKVKLIYEAYLKKYDKCTEFHQFFNRWLSENVKCNELIAITVKQIGMFYSDPESTKEDLTILFSEYNDTFTEVLSNINSLTDAVTFRSGLIAEEIQEPANRHQ